MAKLPGVLALPRMLRHFAPTGEGLPEDGAVEVDAPDDALRAVLSAARSGTWEPAAALLAETRSAGDWYRRGLSSAGLAGTRQLVPQLRPRGHRSREDPSRANTCAVLEGADERSIPVSR